MTEVVSDLLGKRVVVRRGSWEHPNLWSDVVTGRVRAVATCHDQHFMLLLEVEVQPYRDHVDVAFNSPEQVPARALMTVTVGNGVYSEPTVVVALDEAT